MARPAPVSQSPRLLPPQDLSGLEALKARDLLGAFLLMNLAASAGGVLLAGILRLETKDPLLAYIVYSLTFLLTCTWTWQRGRQAHLQLGKLWGSWRDPIPWGSLLRLVLALVMFSLGTTLLMLYGVSLISPALAHSMLDALRENTPATALPLVYQGVRWLSVVGVAPLAEEWLFRGILLHRWSLKWGIPKGLLASSIVFGLLHPNPIGLSMFGLVMGLLYLQTRSLRLPVLAHMLNNSLALLLGSLGGKGSAPSDPIDIFYLYNGLFCAGLAGWILVPFIRLHWPGRSAQLPYVLNS